MKIEDRIGELSTKALCDELARRDGVEAIVLDPYEVVAVEADGPAVIFVVND